MTNETIMHYLQMQYRIHGFPVHIYSGGKSIGTYEYAPCLLSHFDEIMVEYLATLHTDVALFQAANLVLYGAIKEKTGELAIMIGPVRTINLERDSIGEIAHRHGVTAEDMAAYIETLPMIGLTDFANIISGIHAAVNDAVVLPDELYRGLYQWKPDVGITRNVLTHEEAIAFDELPRTDFYRVEQQLLYYVRNGMVSELKERWQNLVPENLFALTNDYSVRNAKNHCILGLALITDAAIKAGLSPETAFKMRELYMRKTEQCTSLQQVMQLRSTILCDFSERARRIQYAKPDSPMIDRAVTYILEHITNEITLADVADYLNTGKTYLSTKFKEEMGIGFTDFVNSQKVEKSKELLLYTDKSLAEIAAYFSFSSQGYFQTVFRKFTGTTPNAFRKSETARVAYANAVEPV